MKIMTRGVAAVAALAILAGCGVLRGGGDRPKGTPVLGKRMPILASERDIAADDTLANVQVLLPPADANADWTQPSGNAAKAMGHVALGTSLSRAWTAQIRGGSARARLGAAPIVAGGTLYVMDSEGAVNALDAGTGAVRWRQSTVKDNDNRAIAFGGGVSFADGVLYATNGIGDVVAMNPASGAEVWRKKPGGPLRGSPTVANGVVYVLSQDNQLYALNAPDGAVLWTQSGSLESQGVFGVAAPAAASGTVVVGFSSGELNAYRYENGRLVWGDTLSRSSISTAVSSLSDIDANPVIDNGRVFALGQGGRLVAIELVSGNRLWEQALAGISTPWVAGEWLFVVTDDARLLCISRANGRIRWIAQLSRWENPKKSRGVISWQGPVLAGGRLVLLNSEGQTVFASPDDGRILGTIDGKQAFSLPPVVAGGVLYTLDEQGRLSAYR